MIQSMFLLSPTGEVLIERHFRAITPRSVCDQFWERASASLNHHGGLSTASTTFSSDPFPLYDTVPPIMEVIVEDSTPSYGEDRYCAGGTTLYLFSILRDGLSYLAVCPGEIAPLLVVEFLHRIADTFVDYFGSPADEGTIKDNFSTVYQLLEEMCDYGYPLTTEANALQAMIRPPTVMTKLQSVVTGGSNAIVSDAVPSGTMSTMPWRMANVKHTNNEIYIDIIEEIDAVLDVNGAVISYDLSGFIQAQSHLSGVPDLLLTFNEPQIIDDCSFHPCVRYNRFEKDRVLSFVPPDGNFLLMRYRVKPSVLPSGFSPPIVCTPQIIYSPPPAHRQSTSISTTIATEMTGKIVLNVMTRQMSSLIHSSAKKAPGVLEDVIVTIPFPKIVKTVDLNASVGQVLFDEVGKVAKWTIGSMDEKKRPQLTGTMVLNSNKRPEHHPPISLSWKIPLGSWSGLSVSGMSLTGESYKPYKGVRNIAKSGRYQIRCN